MSDRVRGVLSTAAVWISPAASVAFRGQFDAGWPLRATGWLLVVAGVLLFVGGALALRHVVTSSFSPKALVTDGIYRYVRHPSYIGGGILLAGLAMLLQSTVGLLVTALLAWPAYVWSALEEQRRLLRAFGAEYEAYRARTLI